MAELLDFSVHSQTGGLVTRMFSLKKKNKEICLGPSD